MCAHVGLKEIFQLADGQFRVSRNHQHQPVPQQVSPPGDQALGFQVVGPFRVGGQQQLGVRPVFHLLHQGRGGGVAGDDPRAGLPRVAVLDFIQRTARAGGGEDDHGFLRPRGPRRLRSGEIPGDNRRRDGQPRS